MWKPSPPLSSCLLDSPWRRYPHCLQPRRSVHPNGSKDGRSSPAPDERLEQVNFSRPYYRSGAQIFVAEDNADIASKANLEGKKIGVVKASTFKDIAVTLTDEDKVTGYDSDVIALQDLVTGRVDAVITDKIVGFSAINENGLAIKPVADPLYVDEMGIAIHLEDTELVDAVNAALEEMIADGTYDQISTKWFGRSILGE